MGVPRQWFERLTRSVALSRALLVGVVCALLVIVITIVEMRTYWFQSRIFTSAARQIGYDMGDGPSPAIRFPSSTPYDVRHGYSDQQSAIERLVDQHFKIDAQARWSPAALRVVDAGLFPVYTPKAQAGLVVNDRHNRPVYVARHPARVYARFEDVPAIVVESLLFIENRDLLGPGSPRRNPAIEPIRFGRAVLDQFVRIVRPGYPASGGSTLATQLEKLRHSSGGRTSSVGDKGRQMISASLRAYRHGPDTLGARQALISEYLNALPLGAIAGYGEVIGLSDGLWAWYDADVDDVNQLLGTGATPAISEPREYDRAVAYRKVLTLLLAARRPTTYLTRDPDQLETRVDAYLHLLADGGVIAPALRDHALAVRPPRRNRIEPPPLSFPERKGSDGIRVELLERLGLDRAYDLDRLDLAVRATIDDAVQQAVTAQLRALADPAEARAAGLTAGRLIGRNDPSALTYAFTLYERTPRGSELLVQVDTWDSPLNISEGSRLELGSTAKLRTMVSYLEVVEALHRRYVAMPAVELQALTPPSDRLSRWAIDHLIREADRSVDTMLDAAMRRRYSASPDEAFFTGGGLHRFRNFDGRDNSRAVTVREAFEQSVNLPFIRLMRDIVQHHAAAGIGPSVLADPDNPMRRRYLERFADREGREFLARFHARHGEVGPGEALDAVARAGARAPARLSAILRTVRPAATVADFRAFLDRHDAGRGLSEARLQMAYEQADPARWTLQDLGYLARVHPLELWLVGYLDRHPAASVAEVVGAGEQARQDAYAWLFRTANRRAQDRAIQVIVEIDAFDVVHEAWRRQGYPFQTIVPSYATAIGSSGDNPAALAALVGVVQNGGLRQEPVRITEIRFGTETPYETWLSRQPDKADRVLSAAVAARVREELVGVVELGTGRRLAGGVRLDSGRVLPVGGKTGTGDNRFTAIGPGGRSSRAINRTAAFVFTIGDRYFGSILAFVPGEAAAAFEFTSALPVQILRHLLPALVPIFDGDELEHSGESDGRS